MAIIPRWKRLLNRDWKDPFEWFAWRQMADPKVLFRYAPMGRNYTGAMTFARADASTYVDSTGTVQAVAANVLRNQHYINGVGPYTLLEGSRANLCKYSNDVTQAAWTKRGTAAAALTATGPDGVANSASAITGVGAQSVNDFYQLSYSTTVGNTVRWEPSFWIRRVSTSGTLRLQNSTGVGNGIWDVNLATIGPGWVRITRSTTGVTVTTEFTGDGTVNNGLQFYAQVGGPLAFDIWGVQAEGTAATPVTFSSSTIPTTASAITRAADSDKFAAADAPIAQTWYTKLVSGQPSNFDGSIVAQRGSNAGARLVLSRTSGAASFTFLHNNGSASVSATVNATVAINDVIELRAILNTDGSVQLGVSINGAAETIGAASAANALTTAWGDGFDYINNDSALATQGYMGGGKHIRAAGVQSLNTMRNL